MVLTSKLKLGEILITSAEMLSYVLLHYRETKET